MPKCPGCLRDVSYGDLPAHVRACAGIWHNESERESSDAVIEQVSLDVADLRDRFDSRLGELDRRVSRIERTQRGSTPNDET